MPDSPRPIIDLATTCACGAVSVSVKGPVYSMFMCSCEDCQRSTGTGHSASFIVDPSSLTVTGPTAGFERVAASGATFTRTFCPSCGTPLYGRSSRTDRAAVLPVGLFGSAAAAWYVPRQLLFSRSHRDWDALPEDLPRYETYPPRPGG